MAQQQSTVRRLLGLLGAHRALIACSLTCAAGSVVCTLYLPVLIGNATDLIVGAGNVGFAELSGILARMAAVALVTALLQWAMNLANNRIAYVLARDLRNRAFANLERLPLRTLDDRPSGDTVPTSTR